MWKKPGPPVPLDPSQVVVGLYVWLAIPWDEHPFLTNRVMVASERDVAVIQSLSLQGRLFYHPERSTAEPAPLAAQPSGVDALPEEDAATRARQAIVDEIAVLELRKKALRQRQQDAAVRAERAWESAAHDTREALQSLARSPRAAGERLDQLSRETAAKIAQGREVLLHLLGDKKEQGPQFHALNVMTLSMLLGKRVGLSERELQDLALGALAHDVGKTEVPAYLLRTAHRKKHEEDFYRQHVAFSLRLATATGKFTAAALAVIADHHEAADGSGWPAGQAPRSVAAQIVALVNRYDNLCSPEAPDTPAMMPAEALAHLFRNEGGRFDPALLAALIKLLGIYPPGTVVLLSDGSLALVVAPSRDSLRPHVVIYAPETDKDQAPVLDLSTEGHVKVAEAVRPATLPADVLDWLNPRQRLSYYFSVDES